MLHRCADDGKPIRGQLQNLFKPDVYGLEHGNVGPDVPAGLDELVQHGCRVV